MYYSSDSSDNENAKDYSTLDFSYLLMDTETVGLHLRNSILENIAVKEVSDTLPIQRPAESSDVDASSSEMYSESGNLSVRKRPEFQVLRAMNNTDNDESNGIRDRQTEKLLLQHNVIINLPFEIVSFTNIKHLDLSNNNLFHVNDYLLNMVNLQTLYIKNNELRDDGLPKDLSQLTNLKELNLSGNHFTMIPLPVYESVGLKYLYMASNAIGEILPDIKNLESLQILHLGGNNLERVPDELGNLHQLGVLALCDNKIRRLPRVISKLKRLRSLLLHKNNMCCLPVEIVKLTGLTELSLRDNPLVNKFINCCAKEIMYTPPSLLELSARVIKLKNLSYGDGDLPCSLAKYINSGHKCVNPKCKGMYFSSCVAHVKFVDFCGKYRVPLMHYLCSSKCSSSTPTYYKNRSDSESEDEAVDRLRRVLLG